MKKTIILCLAFYFISGICVSEEIFFGNNTPSLQENDTIRSLVISEVRMDDFHWAYLEITNMSETNSVDLSEIEIGSVDPWTQPWNSSQDFRKRLPQVVLWPGESFVVANVFDLAVNLKSADPERWEELQCTQIDWWDNLADLYIHPSESEWGNFPALDSVTPAGWRCLEAWGGQNVWYLRQYFSPTESAIIDEVNADFSEPGGYCPAHARNVAGVSGATGNSILIRKFTVKSGDLFGDDWGTASGTTPENSEWIVMPLPKNGWGKEGIKIKNFWTVGNHGNFSLTPSTFQSTTIDINWNDTVLTVPWGTRNEQDMMSDFDYTPGIAWKYERSGNREDSAFTSARNGDKLTIYIAGDKLEVWSFKIEVAESANNTNIVVPKNKLNPDGSYGSNPFNVTLNAPGMDTIYDVSFATRTDTLLEYLEKAPAASWEIELVDGITRPDLKNGDRLKVTAQDGSVKNYYIKVDAYLPSHDATLSSITWPDMPAYLLDESYWQGDTIPGFTSSKFNYTVKLPYNISAMPALVAKTNDPNATFTISRAKFLDGPVSDRTAEIFVAAEDDTTFLSYQIIFEKEIDPETIQPFKAEPFFSQRAHKVKGYGSAMEICNPGNVEVDLSNYMLVRGGDDGSPAAAIEKAKSASFASRYNFYIPGRVWGNETSWQTKPYTAIDDNIVNPVVEGGDVFVVAALGGNYFGVCDKPDVEFWPNPWGDTLITAGETGIGGNPASGANTDTYYLFKILNDSVRNGEKSVGDASDFELIDVFGNGDGSSWVIGGYAVNQPLKIIRRPEFWQGKPSYKESFGNAVPGPQSYPPHTDSEWDIYDSYWYLTHGLEYPPDMREALEDLGLHTFVPPTIYKSTVSSSIYKVSPGYSVKESIKGIIPGTTVDQFLAGINKNDPGETLILKSGNNVLSGDMKLKDGDTLVVKSQVYRERDGDPQKQNTTKYMLDVTASGLDPSGNAILTSSVYTISITGQTGTVSGFPYGTSLKTVADNVCIPSGATFAIVDAKDKWVPFTMMTYDTTYKEVLVNDQTFFEVIAENKVTTILYQLKPTNESRDVFVESNIFGVDQANTMISFVPQNITVDALLRNLIPSEGATLKVIDKTGIERTTGKIYIDDKVVVSLKEEGRVKVYYLSLLSQDGLPDPYTAYILSDVYYIDQLNLWIGNINICYPSSAEFLSNLISYQYNTVTVVDRNDEEVTDRLLKSGDKVKVVSANGKFVVYYEIDFYPCNDVKIVETSLRVYPNPTTGKIQIDGLQPGIQIRFFNSTGVNIQNATVSSTTAEFSLAGQPPGIYLILAENDGQITGRFKVVKN